jgi:hypothetical protein
MGREVKTVPDTKAKSKRQPVKRDFDIVPALKKQTVMVYFRLVDPDMTLINFHANLSPVCISSCSRNIFF